MKQESGRREIPAPDLPPVREEPELPGLFPEPMGVPRPWTWISLAPPPPFAYGEVIDCGECGALLVGALREVCTTGLRHMEQSGDMKAGSLAAFARICNRSHINPIPLRIRCKYPCTSPPDPSPCAWGAPPLPIGQGRAIGLGRYVSELISQGGITITVCVDRDGACPSRSCKSPAQDYTDLRRLLLHELLHYALNEAGHPHRSSAFGQVGEVRWGD